MMANEPSTQEKNAVPKGEKDASPRAGKGLVIPPRTRAILVFVFVVVVFMLIVYYM